MTKAKNGTLTERVVRLETFQEVNYKTMCEIKSKVDGMPSAETIGAMSVKLNELHDLATQAKGVKRFAHLIWPAIASAGSYLAGYLTFHRPG
ncbi:MAG TPA: hypothetical protein PL193_07530 [Xanthobacteraceae bacterium]|nr:hypothetical protein [Xanthobacteraceae bacterium]